MRFLLDTHAAIWSVVDRRRLPPTLREQLENPDNEVFVSAISIAEIAIKWPLQRTREQGLSFGADEALRLFSNADFMFLDFKPAHALVLEELPMKHRDPFDRMLICQALEEPMRLVTHDAIVASYSDSIIQF